MKHGIRVILSLVLSAVFLWLAVRGVSPREVAGVLGRASLPWIVPIVLAGVVSLGFRAIRWRIFCQTLGPVSWRTLVSATMIGFAANMLLPLRAGEIVRPWLLARREHVALAGALATVALERLFDMAALLLFFAFAALTLPVPPEWRAYGGVFLAVFLGFLVALVCFQRFPLGSERLLRTLLRPLPARFSELAVGLVHPFVAGLASLGSVTAVGGAVVLSIAVWLANALCFGFGLLALGLSVPFLQGALATSTFVAIAVAIPGGPGFVGMFQLGCVVALEIYGVPRSDAFGYSVLVHVVQFATVVVLGLYFFLRENLSVRDLREIQAPGAAPSSEAQG